MLIMTMVEPIETERLILRNIRTGDAPDWRELNLDGEGVLMMKGRWEEPDSVEKYAAFLEEVENVPGYRYVIELKGRNKVIGDFGFIGADERSNEEIDACKLQLHINPQYRRQGYGEECLKGLIPYLFREGCNLLAATVSEINTPALALLEKMGFVREGIIHKGGYYPGIGAVDQVSLYLEKP